MFFVINSMSHLLRSLWESFKLYEIQQISNEQTTVCSSMVQNEKKLTGLQNWQSFDRYTRTTSFILPPAFCPWQIEKFIQFKVVGNFTLFHYWNKRFVSGFRGYVVFCQYKWGIFMHEEDRIFVPISMYQTILVCYSWIPYT